MKANEVHKKLKSIGTEQNRKIYAKHGVSSEMYGVSFANLNALKKQIKKDQILAEELWESGYHDSRILATMIADPQKVNDNILEKWVKDLDNYIISDAFSKFVAGTELHQKKAEEWKDNEEEWIGRTGWLLMARLAMKTNNFPDSYFINLLNQIEKEIHSRKNRTRDAMNNALIAIGTRNGTLEKPAIESAEKIGKVEVDHGETGCKTPDATEYILKTKKRKSKKT